MMRGVERMMAHSVEDTYLSYTYTLRPPTNSWSSATIAACLDGMSE